MTRGQREDWRIAVHLLTRHGWSRSRAIATLNRDIRRHGLDVLDNAIYQIVRYWR